jgi:hypothetical protein
MPNTTVEKNNLATKYGTDGGVGRAVHHRPFGQHSGHRGYRRHLRPGRPVLVGPVERCHYRDGDAERSGRNHSGGRRAFHGVHGWHVHRRRNRVVSDVRHGRHVPAHADLHTNLRGI